jgi:hypothetical protein
MVPGVAAQTKDLRRVLIKSGLEILWLAEKANLERYL